jgi:hypothetical protein
MNVKNASIYLRGRVGLPLFLGVLGGAFFVPAWAQNIEDLPVEGGKPSAPAAGSGEMIMVPRAVWEKLLRDVDELKRKSGEAPGTGAIETPPLETPKGSAKTGTSGTGSRNFLLLPDISFITQANGLLSSDRRDRDRNNFGLEGELGIQGYVYPGVKLDAFVHAIPTEDEFTLEEAYVTFLNLGKGVNLNVGRKFAPFGRTGELHGHSYLYNRQLLPIRNLVSEESLVGNGVNLNYVLPTKGKLFARASFGVFTGGSHAHGAEEEHEEHEGEEGEEHDDEIMRGPGASFENRFYNARFWLGYPLGKNGEVELGASHAWGTSELEDEDGEHLAGRLKLSGVDLTYRKYFGADKRLLLRGEYFKYKPGGALPTVSSDGYYALADYRMNKFNAIGVLHERSDLPQTAGARENATSLIYTRHFNERFYFRAMGTHGRRGGDSYNELRLQVTAGLGPHTHNVE